MKMEPERSLGKGPLPGDRQGVLGASAGHDSERTAGDSVLMRRVPVIKETTAQPTTEVDLNQASTSTAPQPGGPSSQLGKISRGGGGNKRIKWSREMNIEVIKTFYRINRCEDKPLPGYRQLFHAEYCKNNPQMNVTEQNLIDRRNAIIKKGYLTLEELNTVRREVGNQLNHEEMINSPPPNQQQCPKTRSPSPTNQSINRDTENPDQFLEEIKEKFYSRIAYFLSTDPSDRPFIPILKNPRKASSLISKTNRILEEYFKTHRDLDEIQLAIYCAAATIVELNNQHTPPYIHQNTPNNFKPAWKIRLEKSINRFRANAHVLDEFLKCNMTKKIESKVNTLAKKAGILLNQPESILRLTALKDTFRQKSKVKGARLRRYNELTKRKEQNANFFNNRRKFFTHLDKTEENIDTTTPQSETFLNYWTSIWSYPKNYKNNAPWIRTLENQFSPLDPMKDPEITKKEIEIIIKKVANWKSPGPDKIHNFWLKYLTAAHTPLAQSFTEALQEPCKFPKHLTIGNTYLLYKKGDYHQPENYRPITCLSVIYKLFTSLISDKIREHCEANQLLEEEQKGCTRGALGCKQQLTIDGIILKQARVKARNLHMGYIDYKKAFDSVPHDWLIRVLQIYKISPTIIGCLDEMMKTWRINLHLSNKNIGVVDIRRGIFQGDSLSPAWFCLALNPLSTLLKQTKLGYKLKRDSDKDITHLLFMDDIKLYSDHRIKLQALLDEVRSFSQNIGMSFGLDKCATINIKRGKTVNMGEAYCGIDELRTGDTYKYLGISQNANIDHTSLKKEFTHKYKKRVTKLMNTKLSGGNIITAINTWAVPVLTYSFGILKWSDTDLNGLDRVTRTILNKFRYLHPNSSVSRLYLPRKDGGRGLINIWDLCRGQEARMRSHLVASGDRLIQEAREVDENYTPLNLSKENHQVPTREVEPIINKALHGKFPRLLEEPHIDKALTHQWIRDGQLYPETEGFVMAIQDRVIRTRNYEKHVLKIKTEDRCRKCGNIGETIEHIMGGCSALAETAYLGRHNQLAKLVHQQLGIKHGLLDTKDTPPYYKYCPAPVLENSNTILYWDRPVLTDRTIDYNRPDIMLINILAKTAQIIEIGVPLTHNTKKTEIEKQRKYEELAIQLKNIWKLSNVTIHPIIISVEGVVSKQLTKTIEELALPSSIARIGQKAILLQTCHIVRKFLN